MFGLKNRRTSRGEDCGKTVVLTSSAIEMSDFNLNPFIAFTGGFPKVAPLRVLRKYLYPVTPDNDDGSARFAPYGLRKIESLLVDEFGEDRVVTCTPHNLPKFIGRETKVVGISTMDPLGMGFVSRTYTSLVGLSGEPIAAAEFRLLMRHPIWKRYRPKIVVGGSGAWQIVEMGVQDHYGITTVVIGEGEHSILEVFRKAVNDEPLPRIIRTEKPRMEEIPTIKNPSLFGVVEITRGCGKGCQFCSPTMRTRYSFPLEKIKKEVELNAKAGSRMIILQTDDVFLYECGERFTPNREAIIELIETINRVPGVEFIQLAHAALPPIAYDPRTLEEIAPTLVEKSRWRCRGKRVASIEVGIETGSVRLIKRYMRGKPLPYEPEDWREVVVQAIGILNDCDVYPLATLVVGLPGEKEEDTLMTIELIDELKDAKLFYVPLLFTSEEECLLSNARHANLRHLTELHWEFFSTCWAHNVKVWAPENHRKLAIGSMLMYMLYYRWRHGSWVIRHLMKLADFPNSIIGKNLSEGNRLK